MRNKSCNIDLFYIATQKVITLCISKINYLIAPESFCILIAPIIFLAYKYYHTKTAIIFVVLLI